LLKKAELDNGSVILVKYSGWFAGRRLEKEGVLSDPFENDMEVYIGHSKAKCIN
jgi:hypothetical protein